MDAHEVVPQVHGDLLAGVDLARHPAALYLLNLRSATGRYQMARKLDKAAQVLGGASWQTYPWQTLSAAQVSALVSRLAQVHKPAYVNTILAAVRGVVEQAYDLGQIDAQAHRLIRKVRLVKGGSSEPRGRYVPAEERDALLGACLQDRTEVGRRDAAILACAYPGGLRRAEIAGLRREDVGEEEGTVSLLVRGKGRKERVVYLNNGGADALRDWLAVRGDAAGPLFWAGRRGGHLVAGQGITGQSIYELLKRRAAEAGIPDLGTHDLRRSVASDLLDRTDAVTVAGYLGHASTDTTAQYDRRGERARRQAAQGLQIGYQRREEEPES